MSDATMTKLTLDSLREMLQQAGYSVETETYSLTTVRDRGEGAYSRRPGHRPAGIHPLPRSCAVSLRFSDRIVVGANGTARLTIRCSLRINGYDDRAAGMTRWPIRKSFRQRSGSEQFEFALEVDLILGNGIELADVLDQGRDVYRHLRLLLADARDTLRDLPVDRAALDGSAGPVLLVEANPRRSRYRTKRPRGIWRAGPLLGPPADHRCRLRLAQGWPVARSRARRLRHDPAPEPRASRGSGGRHDPVASLAACSFDRLRRQPLHTAGSRVGSMTMALHAHPALPEIHHV